jgi:imidazoleglycerol-phosphate dehydratase
MAARKSTTNRTATVRRQTGETAIELTLNVDGTGCYAIDTGIPFLDHMLDLLSRHSLIDLTIKAKGDLEVDDHHTVEDVGLCLGQALNEALGDRSGIQRYGWCLLPMDDALSRVAVDLGGRPYLVFEMAHRATKIGAFDVQLVEEFLRAFVVEGRLNLHAAQLYGKEKHHAYESVFKGLARALGMACARDPRVQGVPSSKGTLSK